MFRNQQALYSKVFRSMDKCMCDIKKGQSPFPRPMAHRAAPISASIALGHASANAVKATAGGWSTGTSTS